MAVDGVQNLMRRLNALNAIESAVIKSVQRQTETVRGAAVRLCPVSSGELRGSIHAKVEKEAHAVIGTVYTNKSYAAYVEFGTGPVGQAHHSGISPDVPVSYVQKGWVWPDTEGGFRYTEGQPAQPFMYPALKSMEERVVKKIAADLKADVRKAGGRS